MRITPKRLRGRVAGLLAVCLVSASTCMADTQATADDHGMGKLRIRSQAIGQSLRLTLPMLVPGDIVAGPQAYFGLTWTNVWANDDLFLLDYEMLDTVLALGYGFNSRLGVGLFIDNRSYFGGTMDGFIEGFHDLFGIDQDGRDQTPSNRNVIYRYDPVTGEKTAELSADDLDNTGLSLGLNYTFDFKVQWLPSMNLYGIARYALQSPKVFRESGKLDFGLGLGLSKRWFDRWYAHMVLGYTWFAERGRTSPGQVEFDSQQFSGIIALAWHYSPDVSLIAQYLRCSAVIENLDALNEASHEVHLGFKWRIAPKYIIDFALIENIITMDNSPDFGLHLSLSIGI